MDQMQYYEMYGYGHSGSGARRHKSGDFLQGYRPCYPPEGREAYEIKPMVYSLAHTHSESQTGRHPFGMEVPGFPPDLGVSPLDDPCLATIPGSVVKDAYSGNFVPQAIANAYGPGYAIQQRSHGRSQECEISDSMQVSNEPIWHPRQRYPEYVSPFGSNTDWRPSVSPIEQMSASFNGALSFPSPDSSTTCANCRNRSGIEGVSVSHADQGDVKPTLDQRFQGAGNSILRPIEEVTLFNRQLSAKDTWRIATHNDRLDIPNLEPSKSRLFPRRSFTANAPDNPVVVHTGEDVANNGPTKKRKRKPRTAGPRKPRTLTNEGKAHAKAVRECPGGACADCKRKKTKARDSPVTNLVFSTLITVPSALTSYRKTCPWSLLIGGLQTLHGLSP